MHRTLVALAVVAVLGGAVSLVAQNPPGYIVATVTITDQEAYGAYRAGVGAVIAEHGGELIAASSNPTVLEGEWEATTTVILRFDSPAKALAWYNSDAYQELVRIRQTAASSDFVMLEGRP